LYDSYETPAESARPARAVKEASPANSDVPSFFSTHTSWFLWRRK
jgi:hypothetical protein